MTPKEFHQFIGPKPQHLAEWSSRKGGQINFSLQVMVPMARAEMEYMFSVLEMARAMILRSCGGGDDE